MKLSELLLKLKMRFGLASDFNLYEGRNSSVVIPYEEVKILISSLEKMRAALEYYSKGPDMNVSDDVIYIQTPTRAREVLKELE